MQLYPEKYEKLSLSSEEKSFMRSLDRIFSDEELSYYVLHINPRKKDIGNGVPELFNLLIWKRGILLFRFFETSDLKAAKIIVSQVISKQFYNVLISNITDRLEESRYLINRLGVLRYGLGICFLLPNVSSGDILPLLSSEQASFIADKVLFQDDLQKLRHNGLSVIEDKLVLKEYLQGDNIYNSVFQRLCPEITIPRKIVLSDSRTVRLLDSQIKNDDRAILSYRLDTKQIDIVNRIDRGHQLILACAGSGKSVLLISKCFKIASLNPSEQFLITCYNKNLNSYYHWAIAQAGFLNRNVRCLTFFALCRFLLESNGIPYQQSVSGNDDDFFEQLFEVTESALQSGKIKDRFAGIFIDEVQIFKPEWYRLCFNLLKSKAPDEYFFIIAGDKSQDIKNNIRRGKAPWQGAGEGYPEYRGKTLPIEINYRNSKPINDAIDRFVFQAKELGTRIGVDLTSDPELFLRGTAYREGNDPELVELNDHSNQGEVAAICDAVKRLINKGFSEVDIVIVLYNSQAKYRKNWKDQFYSLLPGIKSSFYKENWTAPTILMSRESDGATYGSRRGITVTSIEGALGLDFRAVILAGLLPLGDYEKAKKLSDFANLTGEALLEKQEAFKKNVNLIYTGCTRAKDDLIVILPSERGQSIYLDLLRDSF